jgi:hypothetical protein
MTKGSILKESTWRLLEQKCLGTNLTVYGSSCRDVSEIASLLVEETVELLVASCKVQIAILLSYFFLVQSCSGNYNESLMRQMEMHEHEKFVCLL